MAKQQDKASTLLGILNGTVPISKLLLPRRYTAHLINGVCKLYGEGMDEVQMTEVEFNEWQKCHLRESDHLFLVVHQDGNEPLEDIENPGSNVMVWEETKSYSNADNNASELQANTEPLEAPMKPKPKRKQKVKESPVMPEQIEDKKPEPVRGGLLSEYGITWGPGSGTNSEFFAL